MVYNIIIRVTTEGGWTHDEAVTFTVTCTGSINTISESAFPQVPKPNLGVEQFVEPTIADNMFILPNYVDSNPSCGIISLAVVGIDTTNTSYLGLGNPVQVDDGNGAMIYVIKPINIALTDISYHFKI